MLRTLILAMVMRCCGSCRFTTAKEWEERTSQTKIKETAKLLAVKNCGTCHVYPPPALLDKYTWKTGILPVMATKLGIGVFGFDNYINNPHVASAVSYQEWMNIVGYYLTEAPDSLQSAVRPEPIQPGTPVFTLKNPGHPMRYGAQTMLTCIDTATGEIYTSDGNTNLLYRWNRKLEVTDSVLLSSPAVSMNFFTGPEGKRLAGLSLIGTIIAEDNSAGELVQLDISSKLRVLPDTIARQLPRPVQSIDVDIDKNGLKDWVICGFGHFSGGLFLYQQTSPNTFRKKIISAAPGPISVVVRDFNKDGWPDLMVLFAHADESIHLYTNNRDGTFSDAKLLSFPPVYGSSGFQLADINKDGLEDIIYTCGDNGDISPILKPYHGMYIYLNKGNNLFKKSYFYPVNGCTKAIAADFDQDGNVDIATIAFFADFKNNPSEKFLFFRQDKPMHFIPYSPPAEKQGRWLTMAAGDYDNDGDIDIVLGNYAAGLMIAKGFLPDWDRRSPITILQNNTLHKHYDFRRRK